jgi:general stress protein CsbA
MNSLLAQWPIFAPVALLVLISMTARMVYAIMFERHFKLNFADAPVYSLFYFSTWSAVVTLLFPSQVAALFAHLTLIHYVILAFAMLAVFPTLYHTTRKSDGNPQWLLTIFPDEGMLTLGERYILAKIGDVIFQQLIAGAMILTLLGAGVSYPAVVGTFVAIFAAAHLYIFYTSGIFWGIYYTTYAALGGFAFTFLIVFLPDGITYAILIHMLFYVLSGILFAKLPRPGKAVYHDLIGAAPAEIA